MSSLILSCIAIRLASKKVGTIDRQDRCGLTFIIKLRHQNHSDLVVRI